MKPLRCFLALVAAGIGLLHAPWAGAQQAPDAGGTLRELQQPETTLPVAPAPELELEQATRPAQPASGTVRFELREFRFSGNHAIAGTELQQLVGEFVGREVGFADLEEAAARVTRFYRERGYPVARAYLPAQDIAGGSVEIAVLEGTLGAVEVENASRLAADRIDARLRALQPGTAVYGPRLERSLMLLGELGGAATPRAVLRPGANVGETDLLLKVPATPLLSGSIGYENSGNRYTGRDRLHGAIALSSPFGWGDTLSFSALKEFPGIDYGAVDYRLPLGADGLWLHGGYARLRYDLGLEFAPLDASGDAHTWNGGARYPLVRSRRFNVYLGGDVEYAAYQDRLDEVGTLTDRDNLLGTGSLAADFHDGLFGGGLTALSLGFTRGSLDLRTPAAAAIDAATLRTDGNWQRWNFDLLRLQRISERMSLLLSLRAQKALENLDSSQKFIAGGRDGVRAFAPGEASGDTGYLLRGELRREFVLPALPGSLQASLFLDHARITLNEDPFVPGDNHRNLSAAGLGFGWSRAGDWLLEAQYARRIGGAESREQPGDDARFWLQAMKYF